MKHNVKRILSALLVLCMVLSVLPTSAFAATAADLKAQIDATTADGTITLNEDYVCDETIVVVKNLIINLNGHTISANTAKTDLKLFQVKDGATLTVTGSGTVAGTNQAFAVGGGSATEGWGVGHLAIDSDVTVTGKYGAVVTGSASSLTVKGKIQSTAAGGAAICGNGNTDAGGTVINIANGAAVTSDDDVAIYHPQKGTLNISGGTVTGTTAVYVKSGTLNISGGTLIGNGTKYDYASRPSGATATGDALVIENCNTPGGTPVVSITGGTFKSTNAAAVGSYAETSYTPVAGFITGGVFSSDVSKLLAKDYDLVNIGDGTFGVTTYYNVKFVADGILVEDFDEVPENGTITVPTVPTKAGYTGAWTPTVTGTTLTVTANATYTATYTANEYDWTAKGNTTNKTGTATFGGTFDVPGYDGTVPAGKQFIAWAGDDGHYYLPNTTATYTTAGNLTLTPVFDTDTNTEYWIVKFVLSEGGEVFDVKLIKQAADAVLSELPAVMPNKTGYNFNKWIISGTTTEATATTEVTGDMTIVAAWNEASYTVTYYDVDGTASTDTVTYPANLTAPGYTAVFGAAAAPEGKNFLGWVDQFGSFYIVGKAYAVTNPINLYPVFEGDTTYWLVKFVVDGTLYDVIAFEKRSGQTLTLPTPDPTKEGYTFVGWFDAAAETTTGEGEGGGEGGAPSTSIASRGLTGEPEEVTATTAVDGNATYYAHWTANSYTVTTVDAAHVTLTSDKATAKIGEVVTVTVTPQQGYKTYYINVLTESGKPVALSQTAAQQCAFVMPAENVTVTVTEQAIGNLVKFLVDDEVYSFCYVPSGNAPVAPVPAPTKSGFTLVGWRAASNDTLYEVGEAFTAITADETYTAEWKANTYTLTYYRGTEADDSEYKCILVLPDGTEVEFFNNDTTNKSTYAITGLKLGEKIELGEPALPGYNFLYWLAEDGTHYAAGQKLTMPAEDVTLTAVWELKEDNVIILFRDGDKIYDLTTGVADTTATIPTVDPTADGKVFLGWVNGSITYSNDNVKEFTVVDNDEHVMTFEASWKLNEYTITYDGNGATAPTDEHKYNYGDPAVLAAAPVYEGYTFIAWEADNGAYYGEKAAIEVKGDLNLKAVWKEDEVEYAVKFFDEKGNLVDIVFVNKKVGEIASPKYEQGRTDATYEWRELDADGNVAATGLYAKPGEGKITVTRDLSFKAVKTGETEYDVNLLVAPNNADTANAANVTTGTYKLGETVCVQLTVPEGYILKSVDAFAGGVAAANAVTSSLIHVPATENYNFFFTMPAANVSVMIEFEKIPAGKSYVKFMVDGELFDSAIVTKGEAVTTPAAPTKAGYAFTEWKSGTTVVGAETDYTVPADAADVIVFEAQFTQDTYTVDYDTDGGVPQPTASSAVYGEEITLAEAPVKAGYIFIGWVEKSTGFLYAAKATYTVTGDVNFTAKWEQAECIVRFIDPTTGIIYGYEPIHEGDRVTAPAAPTVSGKTFVAWVNAADDTDKVSAGAQTAQIYTNTTYHATYVVSEHNIKTVANNATITITAPAGATTAEVGGTVKFKVTADKDYALSSVVLTYTDGPSPVVRELFADENGVYSFVMPDADVTVTATAVQNVFNINPMAGTYTTINTNGVTKAEAGEMVAFMVEVTDPNYRLLNVVVVGEDSQTIIPVTAVKMSNDTIYTFTMPAEDVIIATNAVQAERTVTFLDSDNTLLKIVPVGSGDLLDPDEVPAPTKTGYTFDAWVIMPGATQEFDPEIDAVEEDLIVKATYVGDAHTVEAGLKTNLDSLKAQCTVSSGNVNSSDLLQTKLNAETGKTVYFTVAAEYDWVITDVAVVSAAGTDLVVEPILREKKTENGLTYYTYAFEMPAEDVKIDVYTTAKLFNVRVEENIPEGGDYTINGHFTNNLWAQQGEEVVVAITPNPGYEIVGVSGTYINENGDTVNLTATWDDTTNEFTFIMVARDVKIEVEYEAIDYTIDIETSNFLTYKPDTSKAPILPVESLDPDKTTQGMMILESLATRAYEYTSGQYYEIPENGTANVGDRVKFMVANYIGYKLESIKVTYDNGEMTCPLTLIGTSTDDHITTYTYCFDMPADDVVITATFVEETYTVTKDATSEAHGKVTMNGLVENTIYVDYKDEVEIVVTPDAGYQVTKISYTLADGTVLDFDAASYMAVATPIADQLDTAHSIKFHMPASAVTVSVEYAKINYSITDVHEEADVTYPSPKNVGDQVTFTTKAHYGYIIEKVCVVNNTTGERVEVHTESTNQLNGASYTFTMPASAVTIHVETIKDEYNVKYLDNGALIAYENIEYLDTANVSAHVADVVNGKAGYHFVGWTSSDVQTPVTTPSVTDADFVVVKDTIIRAAYAKDEIDVFFTETKNGTVTELFTGDNHTAEYRLNTTVFGDKVSFTAVPDEGYVIDTVSVTTTDGEGYNLDIRCTVSGNKYTFMIPASYKDNIHTVQAEDVVVTVTFKKGEFTLTKANDCETNGTIAVNGEVTTETSFTYLYQDAVSITATPNNGYYVAGITAVCGDGTHKFTVTGTKPAADTAVGAPLTLAFAMPACDLTYTVDYEKIDYTITTVFDATQGDVTTDPASIAQIDDIVTVTVTPKTGYKLVSLTVTYADGEKSCVLTETGKNVYTFTMPAAAVTVTATFDEVAYKATLKVEGEAYVSLNGQHTDSIMEQYLDTVTVSVTPDAGWELVSITVDGGKVKVNETIKPAGGEYTFTMPNRDVTVEVKLVKTGFDMTAYALNFFESGHGTVTLDPKAKAYVGDRITISADPDDGYRVHEVVVVDKNGNAVPVSFISGTPGYVESWSFTMPACDVKIVVYFILNGSSYYTDVRTDDWYYDAVTFVTDRGYFLGMTEDLFAPNLEMNRAMFVTVLGRISRVDVTKYTTTKFADVDTAQYYAPYVAWAEENGIVLGRDEKTFDPLANITREEMAAIMYRYCKFLGEDMTIENPQFMDRYVDAKDISDWAKESVEWAVGVGLIKGMSQNTIDPQGLATRAQVAQVIKNLCDKVLYE